LPPICIDVRLPCHYGGGLGLRWLLEANCYGASPDAEVHDDGHLEDALDR